MQMEPEYKTISDQQAGFGHWAVLELLGHVKVAGYITEEEHFGSKLGRIDIPGQDGGIALTQFFGGQSVYRLTPVSEATARAFAAANQSRPVTKFDLQQIEAPSIRTHWADDDDIDL